jgi:anti-sigma regulatory factor (Ser/Thr protein kinase)
MPAAGQTFELHLRNDLSELRRVDEWVRDVAEQLHLHEEVVHSVDLCLIEAVTNVILHGGVDTSSQGISLSIQGLKDIVTASVKDGGRPFDPLSYVPHPKPKSLQEGKLGGNGIRLIRQFATTLSYKRQANQNSLILTFER